MALPALLLLGLGLRAFGAARAGLTLDESVVWAFAREISLEPGRLHFASRTADHPLLGAYVVRLSSLLFGESDAGLRALGVLFGTATIYVAFRLGSELWAESAGLIAAALVAVDRFHLSWSRLAVEEVVLLFFECLALLFFWRAVKHGAMRDWIAAGFCLGAAYLAKETALLLFLAFAVASALSPGGRRAWRTKGPPLALVAALAVAAIDLTLNLRDPSDSYLGRAPRLLAHSLGLTLKASSLFLGELYRLIIHRDVLDADYDASSAYATFWPVGLVYLAGVATAFGRLRDEGVRLLLVVFVCVFGVVTVVDAQRMFDPYWWSSLSFLPALLLASRLLGVTLERRAWLHRGLLIVLLALAAWDITWLARRGAETPRLDRREWARRTAQDGEARLHQADLMLAWEQAHQSLLFDADCAAGHLLLARLLESSGDLAAARRHYERARALDSSLDPTR
jgi:4-amino-4-deoxy-L-arabinose transferase-like glycosyltransferase